MITLKSQRKIVEKIVRTKSGQLVLAVFVVTECEVGLRFRLISVTPIGGEAVKGRLQTGSSQVCLSGYCQKISSVISYRRNYHSVVSPFFDTLKFFVSQPTRAPSAV